MCNDDLISGSCRGIPSLIKLFYRDVWRKSMSIKTHVVIGCSFHFEGLQFYIAWQRKTSCTFTHNNTPAPISSKESVILYTQDQIMIIWDSSLKGKVSWDEINILYEGHKKQNSSYFFVCVLRVFTIFGCFFVKNI